MSRQHLGIFLIFVPLFGSSGIAAPPKPEEARAIRERVETLLRDELTKHWYPQSLDRERGGFHQTFARDWSLLPDENRFIVYQARMTWTAAAFAGFSPKDRDAFASYADYGINYLDTAMRDKEFGGFHWVVGVKGEPEARLGDEKHVYGTAFALYAACKVYETNHNPVARKAAKDAFDWLELHARDAKHGGYFEAASRKGEPLISYDPNAPVTKRTDRLGVYYGFKSMNSHIHLLEAFAEYAKIEKAPIAAGRLRETLALVRDKIAVEPGALNLYLTRDWHATPAHDSFGHDVETAYLLVDASAALGEPDDVKTWRVARNLIDHALDFGWDDEFGGFYDKGDVFAGRAYDTTKVWWTQAEGLNALLLMHTKFGAATERYWPAFLKQWSFIEKHQLDPVHGGWFGEVTREGKLIGDGRKATQWKANYHTGRALMNVAEMLRAVEKGSH